MPEQVPYYRADHALIDFVSEKKAERYVAEGVASAIRSRGRIVRIYHIARERVYTSLSDLLRAMAGAASTTERLRVDGTHIAGPHVRQHKTRELKRAL